MIAIEELTVAINLAKAAMYIAGIAMHVAMLANLLKKNGRN